MGERRGSNLKNNDLIITFLRFFVCQTPRSAKLYKIAKNTRCNQLNKSALSPVFCKGKMCSGFIKISGLKSRLFWDISRSGMRKFEPLS